MAVDRRWRCSPCWSPRWRVLVPVRSELAAVLTQWRALRGGRLEPPGRDQLAGRRRRRHGLAYIKATEGGDFTDARFEDNWREAGAAGLDRGAYHFFTLCRSGRDQAQHFLAVAPPDPAALAPAVDLEIAGNCSRRPDPASVDAELRAFVAVVENAWDRQVIVYVRDDWENRYPVRDELARPLWHFRFLRRPNIDGWVIWQIHGFAQVDGISGRVDLNLMRTAN